MKFKHMSKVLLSTCLFSAFLFACGAEKSNSALDGVEDGISGTTVYRYTAKDADPNFRLAAGTQTGDENPDDDFFSFTSSSPRKFLIWGGYISLSDGGSYWGEIDYEVIGQGCNIVVDIVENEANFVREKVTLGATGRTTWRSHVMPVETLRSNIEFRVTDVIPGSSSFGGGGGFGGGPRIRIPYPCQVKVYEKRIIHNKLM
jgi:hypothetical protein